MLLYANDSIVFHTSSDINPRNLERGGGVGQSDPPRFFWLLIFSAFYSDCQKLFYNSSLFVNTSFDAN